MRKLLSVVPPPGSPVKKQQVLILVADLVDIDIIPLGVEVADDPQSELVAIGFDYSVHGP